MSAFIYTTHASHNPLIQALKEQGVVVRRINFSDTLDDLPQCLAFYGNLFDEIKHWRKLAALKQQLRSHGVPYVFWNRDAPWNTGMKLKNRFAMQWLKPVDIYLAHSLQNHEWFGGQPHYFPNAAQPVYYEDTNLKALRDESIYQYDVSFFGSFGNAKDRNARERLVFLTALESRLKDVMPGVCFKVIDTASTPLSINEQLVLIRSTKINLNYGAMCDLPGNLSWGLPERVFGIPAAGGFMLTDERKSIPLTFSPETCATFSSLEMCVEQIRQTLSDFNVMRFEAEALHREILESHTYRQRARQLIALLHAYRPGSVAS